MEPVTYASQQENMVYVNLLDHPPACFYSKEAGPEGRLRAFSFSTNRLT